jgi:hypothetical protein
MHFLERPNAWMLIPAIMFGLLLTACSSEQPDIPAPTNALGPSDIPSPTAAPAPITAPQQTISATPASASEKIIFVGPQQVDCEGVGPQKCLQIKQQPDEPYTLFYDQIAGFDYEPGYEYQLLIKEEQIANPPADGSSIRWTLIRVVGKTAAQAPK